ncbi:hypothetical protein AAFF_G00350440 [Aldrovandia affinis]|uniref:Uncharacterized protein n=1 Tax=Aldrovandia affinis TaxID=143900 RepID=A0AAD7VZN9_9TELE|nr:hypothetical protein AAFF_G00350440 [Aldrovandia affinis]
MPVATAAAAAEAPFRVSSSSPRVCELAEQSGRRTRTSTGSGLRASSTQHVREEMCASLPRALNMVSRGRILIAGRARFADRSAYCSNKRSTRSELDFTRVFHATEGVRQT